MSFFSRSFGRTTKRRRYVVGGGEVRDGVLPEFRVGHFNGSISKRFRMSGKRRGRTTNSGEKCRPQPPRCRRTIMVSPIRRRAAVARGDRRRVQYLHVEQQKAEESAGRSRRMVRLGADGRVLLRRSVAARQRAAAARGDSDPAAIRERIRSIPFRSDLLCSFSFRTTTTTAIIRSA